jgi:hypothetical protein
MTTLLGKFGSQAAMVGMALVLFLGLTAAPALADLITLIDENSQVQIDPSSQAGMKLWSVDGTNYDAKQWFWYRLGPNGGEQSLDTLTMNGAPFLSDTNGDLVNETVNIKYTNDLTNHGLNINVKFTLQGSGPGAGWSDISEQIRIENRSASTMEVHFFQYNNFILSNGQDTVTFDSNNHVLQTGPAGQLGELVNTGEGVVTGFPKHEGAFVPVTLTSLNDGGPTNFLNGMAPVGPGNVSWAFQWDLTIPAGGYGIISKDKLLNVVPEPASITLLCLSGILGCGWLWRRRG